MQKFVVYIEDFEATLPTNIVVCKDKRSLDILLDWLDGLGYKYDFSLGYMSFQSFNELVIKPI